MVAERGLDRIWRRRCLSEFHRSPDGEWIAFATGKFGFKDETPLHPHNPQSYGELAVIRPDGSDFRQLSDNCWEDSTPRWLPLRPQK